MSDFDDASLVLIPSGYKNQKIYSVKPTDGTGDLTFTRASSATRVASNGLIEKVRTNLLLRSEEFDNATWIKAVTTVVANAEISPDGTQDAETMTVSTSDSRVEQTTVLTAGTYTFSVYVKVISQTTEGQMRLQGFVDAANVSVNFTPTTEWQRFTATYTAAATLTSVRVRGQSFVGTLAVWGAQLETGDIATDYIPTTTAAVSVGPVSGLPRLDYLNSTCPKLLLEPQRTNLALYSEQFNNAAWVATSTTVTANTTISPDGYQNADTMIIADSNSRIVQVSSLGAGTYTISAYVKVLSTTTAGTMRFAPVVDGSNANSFFTPTTEWARYTQTFTAATGVTAIALRGSATGFVGNVAVYGFQIEVGSYATSYIPTLAASVTRVADSASKTGISSLIGQTEGTLFLDFESGANDSIDYAFTLNDGTTTNRIRISRGAGNTITAQIRVAAVTQALIQTATVTPNTRFKCALAYKLDDVALYVNGAEIGVDTSSTIPACSVLATNLGDGTGLFGRPINQVLLFKTRLTNAQLAELTAL